MLADEGVYMASESTFVCVLSEHSQSVDRGRAKAPKQAGHEPIAGHGDRELLRRPEGRVFPLGKP